MEIGQKVKWLKEETKSFCLNGPNVKNWTNFFVESRDRHLDGDLKTSVLAKCSLGFYFKYALPLNFKIQGVLVVLLCLGWKIHIVLWFGDLVFYFSTQILSVWKKSFKEMINANFFHTTYVQLFSIDQKQHTNRTMINLNDPHCALLSKGICHFESYEMSENFWLHTYFSIL